MVCPEDGACPCRLRRRRPTAAHGSRAGAESVGSGRIETNRHRRPEFAVFRWERRSPERSVHRDWGNLRYRSCTKRQNARRFIQASITGTCSKVALGSNASVATVESTRPRVVFAMSRGAGERSARRRDPMTVAIKYCPDQASGDMRCRTRPGILRPRHQSRQTGHCRRGPSLRSNLARAQPIKRPADMLRR